MRLVLLSDLLSLVMKSVLLSVLRRVATEVCCWSNLGLCGGSLASGLWSGTAGWPCVRGDGAVTPVFDDTWMGTPHVCGDRSFMGTD